MLESMWDCQGSTDLGILAAFEEGSNTDQANVVVPHDGIFLLFTRYLEGILKDCSLC